MTLQGCILPYVILITAVIVTGAHAQNKEGILPTGNTYSPVVQEFKSNNIPVLNDFSTSGLNRDLHLTIIEKSSLEQGGFSSAAETWRPLLVGCAGSLVLGALTGYFGVMTSELAGRVNRSTSYDEAHDYEARRKNAYMTTVVLGICTAVPVAVGFTISLAVAK